MTYIRHITLTTGHSRDSYPEEISPEALAVLAPLVRRICAGTITYAVPIPGIGTGYSIAGRCANGAMTATIYADGPPSEVIATIGVCADPRISATIWRALHQWGDTPVKTDPSSPPPVPWCAAALESAIARHMDAVEWLGDFERCLAWAVVRKHDA